jgi:hypothetical protein
MLPVAQGRLSPFEMVWKWPLANLIVLLSNVSVSLEAVFRNKVFFAVLAAINVMNKYVELTTDKSPCLIKEWAEFKNAVLWSRHTMDRNELDIVEKTFKVFYGKINELAGRN